MVALPLIPIAIASAVGLIASVVRIVQHRHHTHLLERQRKPVLYDESETKDGLQVAKVKVNGELITFIRETRQVYAHYDLAIDYCTQHGSKMGFDASKLGENENR